MQDCFTGCAANVQKVITKSEKKVKNETSHVDWKAKTEKYLAEISKKYDNLTVRIGNYTEDHLSGIIQFTPRGNYLYIGKDFLEAMASGEMSFEKGKALLEEALNELTQKTQKGTVTKGMLLTEEKKTTWTVQIPTKEQFEELQWKSWQNIFEKMDEAKKNNEKLRKRLRVKKTSGMMNMGTRIYSRLAKAKSVGQVQGVMSSAMAKLMQLKKEMEHADQADRRQLEAVEAQLRAAVVRSRKKISNLNQEKVLKQQQKRSENERKMREARQTEGVLRRKKMARTAREYAYLRAASIENYLKEQERLKNAAREQSASFLTPSSSPSLPITPAESVGSASVPMSTGIVQVSAVAISVV